LIQSGTTVDDLIAISYGNGQFVAIGAGPTIFYQTIFRRWTGRIGFNDILTGSNTSTT
jgi:hypothetical protein